MPPEEAAALAGAALADEMRRRGRNGPAPAVDAVVPFFAPVRVLVARLHEAAVVRGPRGDPAAEVTARVVETAATALHDSLSLPTAPPLGEIGDLPLPMLTRGTVAAPPFGAEEADFAADAARLAGVHASHAPSLARLAVAFPLSRVLLLRPCRLVAVSSGRTRGAVLVDEAARQATALLSSAAADALREEVRERPLPPAPPPLLRPMRCPACASPYPLDREGQLRVCPSCRRAHLVAGRRLLPLPYLAELPPTPRGRLLAPAWRVPFALADPRDGRALDTAGAVRARCGDVDDDAADGPVPIDVPAFLPADRRRERRGAQRFSALPPPAFPLFEGPARGEAGFPEPRLVGALGPAEAAGLVRHALLSSLRPEAVALASARRLKALLFDAPLRVGTPRLVLRALRRADVEGS